MELNRIYNEDCLEGMKRIPDGSVDCILCDLPYGTTACAWDSIIPFEPLWEQYNRIAKDTAPIILFGQEPFSSMLRLSNIDSYKYDIYWQKEGAANFMQLKKRFGKTIECISIFYRKQCIYNPQMYKHLGKLVTNKYSAQSKRFRSIISANNKNLELYEYVDTGYRYPKDVLVFKRVNKRNYLHPTQKPVELIRYLVRTYSNEGDTILDNCMGSGTTAVAAVLEKRNFIGFELNKEYYDKANARLKELTGPFKLYGNIGG